MSPCSVRCNGHGLVIQSCDSSARSDMAGSAKVASRLQARLKRSGKLPAIAHLHHAERVATATFTRRGAAALRPVLTIPREAAASLGAPHSMVLRLVVLPQLVPAIREPHARLRVVARRTRRYAHGVLAGFRDGADPRRRAIGARLLSAGFGFGFGFGFVVDSAAGLAGLAAADRGSRAASSG